MVRSLQIKNGEISFSSTDLKNLGKEGNKESNLRSREGFRESMVPLQMVLMSFEAAAEIPYKISFFSPGSFVSLEVDEDDYPLLIPQTDLHTHNTYELCIVLEGTLTQRIEASRHLYPKGSCFLLNRNVRHNEEFGSSFNTATLSISEKFLRDTLDGEFTEDYISSAFWSEDTDLKEFLDTEMDAANVWKKTYIDFIPTRDDPAASELFDEIAETMINPNPGYAFLLKSQLCRLLHLLTDKDLFSTVPMELGTSTENRIFADITKLLEKENGRISRRDLSSRMHYSGNYLNRLVKKYTGLNLTEYADSIALRAAALLLINTDLTISEIIDQLSFTNRSYFYRKFEKVYACTPKKFRANHRI